MTNPLRITARALEEIKHIYHTKNIPPQYALRIAIKGGGCGAGGFALGFDQPQPDDQVFHEEEVSYLIDKKHLLYVLDLEIDFEERTFERGFVFNKPVNL